MIWNKIGNIKGPKGQDGVSIAGKPGRDGVNGAPGRDGRDSGTVHYIKKAGFPDKNLGKDGDWCFNEAKEIFFKEKGKWIFYYIFSKAGGGGGGGSSASANSLVRSFGFTVDGGGAAITTGVKGYIEIPYACTITGWTLLADQVGSIVIDVWKDTYANYPPTVADTIAGTEKPTLASVIKNQDLTLTTWTTAVTAGDILGFNVDSASTVTRAHLIIRANAT